MKPGIKVKRTPAAKATTPQKTRMTEDDAYKRLAYSARLLKAVYQATSK